MNAVAPSSVVVSSQPPTAASCCAKHLDLGLQSLVEILACTLRRHPTHNSPVFSSGFSSVRAIERLASGEMRHFGALVAVCPRAPRLLAHLVRVSGVCELRCIADKQPALDDIIVALFTHRSGSASMHGSACDRNGSVSGGCSSQSNLCGAAASSPQLRTR